MRANYVALSFVIFQKPLTEFGLNGFIYGICGNLFQWFSSYLCNRFQNVMYKDVLSSSLCVNAGVQQESVLGPFCF